MKLLSQGKVVIISSSPKKGNIVRVMIGEKDPIDDQWCPTPSSLIHYYEFDEYSELISVKQR